MAELTVEPLTHTNLAELAELFETVDRSHFPHATADAAMRFAGEKGDVHLVGRSEGRVVAFGMLRGWVEGYEVPSLGIAVGGPYEGQGFGAQMMAALERSARERGARQIRLRVHPENERARRLYARCGYREAGLERGEVLMLLDLQPELATGATLSGP